MIIKEICFNLRYKGRLKKKSFNYQKIYDIDLKIRFELDKS